MVTASVVLAAGALAGPSGSAWGDAGAALDAARAALQRRAWPEVVAAVEGALRVARNEAPLVVRQALVVREPHVGLGAYVAVAEPIAARALRLYVEVDNVVDEALPDGRRRVALAVSGRFRAVGVDGTRKELGTVDLGRQELALWRTTGVHSLGLDVRLSEAPPGRYTVELTVADLVGGKTATRPLEFDLR